MKTLEIVGDSYEGSFNRIRRACRGIVIENDRLLMSHGAATDLWMIPGGGLEGDEDERECCIREVAEETGFRILPSECVLEVVEYIFDLKHINRYFFGTVTGRGENHLTEVEQRVEMVPEWIPVEEAISIFSGYDAFAGTKEMRRALYQREYTVLCELFRKPSAGPSDRG